MNKTISFKNVRSKFTRAIATIPTLKGEGHVQIMRAQNGNFFYVSQERRGAEAVFPTYSHVQRNYRALRNMTESEFLNAMSLS